MIYYLSFFLLFFGLIYLAQRDTRVSYIPLSALFVLLTVFAGIRYGLGRDFDMYQIIYDEGELSVSFGFLEPLWRHSILFFKWLGMSSAAWFTLIAGATYACVIYGFRKLAGDYWWLALLAFVLTFAGYFESFNIIRQYLAVAIVLAGYHLILSKKYLHFLPIMLLAILLHQSAVFFIPILLLSEIKIPRWVLLLALPVSFVLGSLVLPSVLDVVASSFPDRYGQYADKEVYAMASSTMLFPIFLNFVALYFIWRKPFLTEKAPHAYRFVNLLVIAISLYTLLLDFEIGARLYIYPFAFSFVLYALSIKYDRLLINRLAVSFIIAVFSLFMLKLLVDKQEPYSSYRTIFNQQIYQPPH